MSTIYKYPLPAVGRNHLNMPAGAKLLTVQLQHGVPTVWAVVSDEPIESRVIDLRMTGETLPPDPGEYIATVQMQDGNFVLHAFDVTEVL